GAEPTVDFEETSKHRDNVVQTLTGGVGSLMKGNKIDVIEGLGSVTGDGNVRVGDDEIEAGSVILAAGSVSKPLLGLEFGERVLDTERAWALRELPNKMAVIGAGASGSEIASAYGRLGTEVTLLEALPQILPAEDEEIAKAVAREIGKQNVEIVTEANVESAEVSDDGVEITYGGETVRFDYLAIAAGRAPDVEGLGLDDAGVQTGEDGRVEVDGHMRTSLDRVYAIGDLVHGPALAHKASDEGVIAVEDAAGLETHPLEYEAIPAATFCHPQVASFGLTETQAREQGYDVVVGKVPMGAVGAPTVYGDRTGMIKIVGDKRYGELLGGHMVGARATDLISELVAVRDLEGGFAEVARIIHPHPTFSEATMEAARATDGWLIHG
ncbi:MAG: NAD(P)/FAD-dependent oxidoreductase, partial [Actinomycetota bacterium]